LTALQALALALRLDGDFTAAHAMLKEALRGRDRSRETDPSAYLVALNDLCVVLLDLDRPGEAKSRLEEILREAALIFGADQPHMLMLKSNLADAYRMMGDLRSKIASRFPKTGASTPSRASILPRRSSTAW
jgi:tetratricopeptide (TPR) repeat protein